MAWECGNLKTKRYQLAWAWLVASFWTFAALAARSPASNDKRKMGKWGHCHHPQYRHPEIQFPMTSPPPSPPFDRPVCCFLFDLPSHQLSPVASASPAPSATKQSTRAGQHGNYLQKLSLHRSKELFSPVSKLSAHLTSASHNTEPEAMITLKTKILWWWNNCYAPWHLCWCQQHPPQREVPLPLLQPNRLHHIEGGALPAWEEFNVRNSYTIFVIDQNIGQMWLCRKYELCCIEVQKQSWTLEALNQWNYSLLRCRIVCKE